MHQSKTQKFPGPACYYQVRENTTDAITEVSITLCPITHKFFLSHVRRTISAKVLLMIPHFEYDTTLV